MLLTDAKTAVAKVLGMQGDANGLLLANDAINATYMKWQIAHDWSFLLEDNEGGFQVTGCTIAGNGTTVTTSVTAGLYGVNVGMTVTGTGIPADTTVASVAGDTYGGGITSFELSAASTPASALTLTFSGYIPVRAGYDMYNLPANFNRPFSAMLVTNPRTLVYLKPRERDRKIALQSLSGVPTHYTIYKKHDFSAGAQHSHLRLTAVPASADNLLLRFYRNFAKDATTIDMLDDYLELFLDDAQTWFLRKKNAGDSRLPAMEADVARRMSDAIATDLEDTDDEEIRMISQFESGPGRAVDFNIWDEF
jgi:hypothetical protein